MSSADTRPQGHVNGLASDEILRIARTDAERVYKDLDGFRITLVLEADGGHVEYSLAKRMMAGGAPHYVIDPVTGEILSKKYFQ
jgi:hypothetical protein